MKTANSNFPSILAILAFKVESSATRWWLIAVGICVALLAPTTSAQEESLAASASESTPEKTSEQTSELIPQNLLRLVHAPEVHAELKLSTEQVESLEEFFAQADGIWFRSRILPAGEQRAIVAKLERQLKLWLAKKVSPAQRIRLEQIEYRSLGIRMLLRKDVQERLDLDDDQVQQLTDLATATNEAAKELHKASTTSSGASEALQTAVVEARQSEQEALKTVLRAKQMQKLSSILGEPFDTVQLERIYPMAPELAPVENWINSQPLTLADLRGKVVVVHFYAFQCHNCHANFPHYQEWYNEFPSDEAAIVGIQTPETSRERDPRAVRAAAAERGFKFPILVDLHSKNWQAWSNTMWPTVYVIDKHGYIRYWHQGELNWNGAEHDKTVHDLIVRLIEEEEAS